MNKKNNNLDNDILLALNIPFKSYIITKENSKAFKRKLKKSEKAIEKWDLDKLEFDKYTREMK